jgi:hypothetical protein
MCLLALAAEFDTVRYWMIGSVDEVAIFDRALSEAEINELMNNGVKAGLAVNASGKLAATWGTIRAIGTM